MVFFPRIYLLLLKCNCAKVSFFMVIVEYEEFKYLSVLFRLFVSLVCWFDYFVFLHITSEIIRLFYRKCDWFFFVKKVEIAFL